MLRLLNTLGTLRALGLFLVRLSHSYNMESHAVSRGWDSETFVTQTVWLRLSVAYQILPALVGSLCQTGNLEPSIEVYDSAPFSG